jgi:hypothetical protein
MRARPITSQYKIASETVAQKMVLATPYGDWDCEPGSRGVVLTFRHNSSLLNGSTARRRVLRVVSGRFGPHGIAEERANWPAGSGQ